MLGSYVARISSVASKMEAVLFFETLVPIELHIVITPRLFSFRIV